LIVQTHWFAAKWIVASFDFSASDLKCCEPLLRRTLSCRDFEIWRIALGREPRAQVERLVSCFRSRVALQTLGRRVFGAF
jgi:hypothetical protein